MFVSGLVNTTSQGAQPQVIDDLRNAILSGAEPPGTQIPIDAVASFFRVSQIPVREALRELLGEGLVEHIQHVGYTVAKLTFAEFRELYDARQALEISALRQAVKYADDVGDATARAAHQALMEAVSRDDEREYHAASRTFHLALIAPARMRRVIHMYESAWNLTEPTRPMSRVDEGEREQFCAEHGRMLEAFMARDVDVLVAQSQAHYAHLKAAIEELSDDPALFRQPV